MTQKLILLFLIQIESTQLLFCSFQKVKTPFFAQQSATVRLKKQEAYLLLKSDKDQKRTVYVYDPTNNSRETVLSSMYSPNAISLLPDESGFSFIQDDMIYLKLFMRRLPKIIEPSEPIYDIKEVAWIDSTHAFVSAKKGYSFGIFLIDTDGETRTIYTSDRFLGFIRMTSEVHGTFFIYTGLNKKTGRLGFECLELIKDKADNWRVQSKAYSL